VDLVEEGRGPPTDDRNGQLHVDFYHGTFVIDARNARARKTLDLEITLVYKVVSSIERSNRLPKTYQHTTGNEVTAHLCLEYGRFGSVLVSKLLHEPYKWKVCPWYALIVHPFIQRCFVSQHENPLKFSARGQFSAQRTVPINRPLRPQNEAFGQFSAGSLHEG
jgi:hypothetical protein